MVNGRPRPDNGTAPQGRSNARAGHLWGHLKRGIMIKVYWNYLKYIIQHKFYVAIECLKMGMPIHAVTHDLSKFMPSEFFPYAEKFFSGDYAYKYFQVESRFAMAWLMHQRRNRHHWDYWVNSEGKPLPMPKKYVRQMIADWKAMGRNFGDTADGFYRRKGIDMILHPDTKKIIWNLLK
jgi:hypothetical protein